MGLLLYYELGQAYQVVVLGLAQTEKLPEEHIIYGVETQWQFFMESQSGIKIIHIMVSRLRTNSSFDILRNHMRRDGGNVVNKLLIAQLLSLLFILDSKACKDESSITIYGITWNWSLSAQYSIEEIKKNSSFIITSKNEEFIEGLLFTLNLHSDNSFTEKNFINFTPYLIIELQQSNLTKQYVSNGEYICDTQKKSCSKFTEKMKKQFDLLAILE